VIRELLTKLYNRRAAYRHAFLDGDQMSKHGQAVLKDLAKFCRANDTVLQLSPVTRTIDPLATAQAAGRREVFLRIMWHLKLTESDMIALKEIDE
jgi:hypothetical protein